MNTLSDIFSIVKKSGYLIILSIFILYFTVNSIKGDKGIYRYLYLKNKIEQANLEKAKYENKKRELEYKVSMLSEKSLDLDYLEERARIVLNMVNNSEYIILDNDINKR